MTRTRRLKTSEIYSSESNQCVLADIYDVHTVFKYASNRPGIFHVTTLFISLPGNLFISEKQAKKSFRKPPIELCQNTIKDETLLASESDV